MGSENHDDKFSNEADHDNVAAMLEEIEEYPQAFNMLKDAMRFDLTDEEFFAHVKTISAEPKVKGADLDEDWEDFKGNFGSDDTEDMTEQKGSGTLQD